MNNLVSEHNNITIDYENAIRFLKEEYFFNKQKVEDENNYNKQKFNELFDK